MEIKSSYEFSIEANGAGAHNFSIQILNVIESPEFTSNSEVTIKENISIGSLVLEVNAMPDITRTINSYEITKNDYLEINSTNGKITLKKTLDYENIKLLMLQVTAKDSAGAGSTQDLTIRISNVNEAPSDITLSNNQVMENQAGAAIGLLSAADQDLGGKITFKTSDSRFEIINGNQLKLKPGVALDHEWTPSTQVAVTATDSKGLSYTESLILKIDNAAGDAPAFDFLDKTLLITERESGLAVTTALALPEVGHHLSYSLIRGSEFFQIDADSGLITIAGAALTGSQYQITVQAFDTDSGLSTIQDLTLDVISITLSNDHIKENTAAVKVGVLGLLGLDSGGSYSFTVDDPRFEVTRANELKLKSGESLDFESSSSVSVIITVTTSTGLVRSGQIEVKVDNVNEAPTEIVLSNNHVAEKAYGAVIGAVTVLDPDLGDNHTLTVSDSRFELRGNLLALKAGQALDFESTPTITLKLTATDLAGLSKQQSLILSVDDVNDPAVITGNKTLTYTEEGNAIQIKSSNLNASDADKTPSFLLTFKVVIDEGQGNPQSGYFYRGSDPSTAIDSFTLADVTSTVASSKIFFKPGTSSVKPVISVIVNDGSVDSAPVDLIVKMTAKNDIAAIAVAKMPFSPGGSFRLTTDLIDAVDEDSSDAQLRFTASGTLAGSFKITGSSTTSTSFSLADVKAGLVEYTHNGSSSIPTITFKLTDANGSIVTMRSADSTGWGKSYVGTAGADNIIGTNGNDSLTQVGALDTFAGMDGNDSFAVDHLNLSLIDGGTGYDTLRLNLDMDFTILADDKLRFIEELNLNGHYCRMDLNDVIAMTDSKNILKITGQSSSTLKIDQNWNFIEASEGFSIYTQGATTLYVGSDITIG